MSKGKWRKEYGVRESVYLNHKDLARAIKAGCDVWDTRSFAALAGYKDVRHFREVTLLNVPLNVCHSIPIKKVGSNAVETRVTCANSAQQAGVNLKAWTQERRGYSGPRTDCSSGSG